MMEMPSTAIQPTHSQIDQQSTFQNYVHKHEIFNRVQQKVMFPYAVAVSLEEFSFAGQRLFEKH